MSRLDELIAELCPDGVEYKELSELFNKCSKKHVFSMGKRARYPIFLQKNREKLAREQRKLCSSLINGNLFSSVNPIRETPF